MKGRVQNGEAETFISIGVFEALKHSEVEELVSVEVYWSREFDKALIYLAEYI